MQFDFTAIFQAILALFGAIITYWLIPYIKSKATAQQQANVNALIRIAVTAAEQLYGAGTGKQKLLYVQKWLDERGIRYDRAEIEAAVREMGGELANLLENTTTKAEDKNDAGGD